MILYRKIAQLRIIRAPAPAPPYWAATTIAPYGSRRSTPIAIDYLDLRASFAEKLEVTVSDTVRDDLDRARGIAEPLLIDATGFADVVFHRSDEALGYAEERRLGALLLVSTRSELPREIPADSIVALAAWPLEFERIDRLAAEAQERGVAWGMAVPILFPVTTNLAAIDDLCAIAKERGASFLASFPLEADATAKKAIADSLVLDDDGETYDLLFHADLEPLHIATERHIAALASGLGIADFITPPRHERRSNWNGAVMLTLAAARMIAMEHEVETAGALARSARIIATLDKPIERIAEAASLAIIDALDPLSVDALTEWLESGRSSFVEQIHQRWRLRRDAGR